MTVIPSKTALEVCRQNLTPDSLSMLLGHYINSIGTVDNYQGGPFSAYKTKSTKQVFKLAETFDILDCI